MLFSRNVPTAPRGLQPSSYVRTKTSPDQWLPQASCEDMLPGHLLGSSTLCFLVLPSSITREQAAELSWCGQHLGSHCSLGSYSGIFPPQKKPLFSQAPWHEKSWNIPTERMVRHPSKFQRAKGFWGGWNPPIFSLKLPLSICTSRMSKL